MGTVITTKSKWSLKYRNTELLLTSRHAVNRSGHFLDAETGDWIYSDPIWIYNRDLRNTTSLWSNNDGNAFYVSLSCVHDCNRQKQTQNGLSKDKPHGFIDTHRWEQFSDFRTLIFVMPVTIDVSSDRPTRMSCQGWFHVYTCIKNIPSCQIYGTTFIKRPHMIPYASYIQLYIPQSFKKPQITRCHGDLA